MVYCKTQQNPKALLSGRLPLGPCVGSADEVRSFFQPLERLPIGAWALGLGFLNPIPAECECQKPVIYVGVQGSMVLLGIQGLRGFGVQVWLKGFRAQCFAAAAQIKRFGLGV